MRQFKNPNSKGKGNYPNSHARGTGELIGKSQCYVYYIQREKPTLYKFYLEYHNGFFIDGYNKFHEDMGILIAKAINIQCFLKENRSVMKIGEWMATQQFLPSGSIYRAMRTNSVTTGPAKYIEAFKILTSNKNLNKQVEHWIASFSD